MGECCPGTVLDWETVPGLPNLQRGITPSILVQMGQVRYLSASTRRVDVDRVVDRPVWLRDEEDTLPRRFRDTSRSFQRLRHWEIGWSSKTKRCKGPALNLGWGGLPDPTAYTIGRVGLPPTPIVSR